MAYNPPRTPLRRSSQKFLSESRPFIASTSSATSDGAGHAGGNHADSHGHGRGTGAGGAKLSGHGGHGGHGLAGLNALENGFHNIVDATEMFLKNVEEMERITKLYEEAADTMAMFIQAQRLNTFCVEFTQAPTEFSYAQQASIAKNRARTPPPPAPMTPGSIDPKTPRASMKDHDRTFATNSAVTTPTAANSTSANTVQPPAKRPAGAKLGVMTNKMKKERMGHIDHVINLLPLDYRGNDPSLRKVVEGVINTLMDAKKPLKIVDIAKGPTLPQAKVNKCLIALVGAKAVTKSTEQGVSHYTFVKSCLP